MGQGHAHAPVTFDEAHAIADRFLGPVLIGEVGHAHWSCAEQRWVPDTPAGDAAPV
jgi:hypothetical protein